MAGFTKGPWLWCILLFFTIVAFISIKSQPKTYEVTCYGGVLLWSNDGADGNGAHSVGWSTHRQIFTVQREHFNGTAGHGDITLILENDPFYTMGDYKQTGNPTFVKPENCDGLKFSYADEEENYRRWEEDYMAEYSADSRDAWSLAIFIVCVLLLIGYILKIRGEKKEAARRKAIMEKHGIKEG